MLSWWAHWRAKDTYTRTSLSSRTPTHTNTRKSVLSLQHSPSDPELRSSAIQDCGEEIQPTSSVCVVPKPTSLSSTSGPHSPLQCSLRTKLLRACNKTTIQALTGENNSLNRSWPYRGQNDFTAIYSNQNHKGNSANKSGEIATNKP